jgi:hypothetical protein
VGASKRSASDEAVVEDYRDPGVAWFVGDSVCIIVESHAAIMQIPQTATEPFDSIHQAMIDVGAAFTGIDASIGLLVSGNRCRPAESEWSPHDNGYRSPQRQGAW